MTSAQRALEGTNSPVIVPFVLPLINTIGTSSAVLFADLDNGFTSIRRVRVRNQHATQSLSLILVPLGQAAASEGINSGLEIPAGLVGELVFKGNQRILIVGSGSATVFSAVSSDV